MAKLLEACNLCFSYGNRPLFQGLNLSIEAGSYTSIIGPNGSGKSTLLQLLYGSRRGEGDILYRGIPVSHMTIVERARQFASIRQNEENHFPFTCLEMVLLGLHPFRSRFEAPTQEQRERVWRMMERTDTLCLADKPVTQVSGGEFQRVILARALAQNPRVLFLDEAMSELDISAKITMTKLLLAFAEETGLTVVAVSHDLPVAYRYSHRVIALRQGKIAAFGPPEQVMDSTFFATVFGVKAEILPGKGFLIHDHI